MMKFIALNESRTRVIIFRNKRDDSIILKTSKSYTAVPFLIIIGNERLVSITPVGRKRVKWLFNEARHRFLDDEESDEMDIITSYIDGENREYDDYPEFFDVENVDRATLYNRLWKKFRISPFTIRKMYPDFEEEAIEGITYRNATIIADEKVSKRTISLAKKEIDDLHDLLDRFGLSWLAEVRFMLSHNSGKLGHYSFSEDYVMLSIGGLRKKTALSTLVHELGHRWENKKNLSSIIKQKWNELSELRSGSNKIVGVEVGDTIYSDNHRALSGRSLTVTAVSDEKVNIDFHDDNGKRYFTELPIAWFDHGMVRNMNGDIIGVEKASEWFPTEYSKTNPHEFFAENFVQWIYGRSGEEVSKWFENLPK